MHNFADTNCETIRVQNSIVFWYVTWYVLG